jgi:sulfoquinovosyltransferase
MLLLSVLIMLGEELSQSFASADVFLMPSDSETLGFVVLESMASGVPVIGANAGGIPNLIDEVRWAGRHSGGGGVGGEGRRGE